MSGGARARGFSSPPWILPAVIAVGLGALTWWSWPPRREAEPHVREGNQEFEARRFPSALERYEAAPGDGVQNAGVHLNRGLARYRIAVPPGDGSVLPELYSDASVPDGYELAQEELRSTARGREGVPVEDLDAWLRARAAYNLANTYFTQRSWQSAIDLYKEALRLRPGWVDAAWNLELARRRKDEDEHPDAGPDAGEDASQDASQDASRDASQDGSSDGGSGDGGSSQGDGGNSQPDGGGPQGDSGSPRSPDGGSDQDAGGGSQDSGTPPSNQGDAGPPPPPPTSLAPLDQLERSEEDLQQLLLRQRALRSPRGPDDER